MNFDRGGGQNIHETWSVIFGNEEGAKGWGSTAAHGLLSCILSHAFLKFGHINFDCLIRKKIRIW